MTSISTVILSVRAASTHYVMPTSMSSCTQPLNRAALLRLSMSYTAALLDVKVGNSPHDHRASTAITATTARVRILGLADVCDGSIFDSLGRVGPRPTSALRRKQISEVVATF